jgi:hypothetical protein
VQNARSLSSSVSLHLSLTTQDEAFEKLHDRYAPVMLDIILGMRGFYIKVWTTTRLGIASFHLLLLRSSPLEPFLHPLLLPFSLGQVGQIGSTRADFMPKQYLERLSTLQSNVPAEPVQYVRGGMKENAIFCRCDPDSNQRPRPCLPNSF